MLLLGVEGDETPAPAAAQALETLHAGAGDADTVAAMAELVGDGDPATPPAPRQDGRTIFTPDGVPNTTTGGTGGVQGINRPGGASGTATPLGNSTVITVPGQSPQIVPDRQ